MVKKRGIVWNYFTKKIHGSQITAFCKFCDQSYIQNATRMEKHIQRCVKCPEDIKQDFMNALRKKRAQSMLTIKLAQSWSDQQPQTIQNEIFNEDLRQLKEWEARNQMNNQISNCEVDNSDINVDSKSWHTETFQAEAEQAVEREADPDWEPPEGNTENEHFVNDETHEQEEPIITRRSHPVRRFSQRSSILSGYSSKNSVVHNKIQQEQYLEKRALRRIAELELQRKTIEMEKFQWEYQREKTQSEVRWAHECRMMQLKEEYQQQLIEQAHNRTITMPANHM